MNKVNTLRVLCLSLLFLFACSTIFAQGQKSRSGKKTTTAPAVDVAAPTLNETAPAPASTTVVQPAPAPVAAPAPAAAPVMTEYQELTAGGNTQSAFDDLPPRPNAPGKCYAKCKVPDCIVESATTVLVKEEGVKKVIVPAEYGTVTEQVLVKEASTKLVPIPAEYETVTEQILVKEASTRIREMPPRYETRSEKVLVSEGHGKWVRKKRYAGCTSVNPEDCYIMCWEEVPAKYETIFKQVLAEPAKTEVIEIPAEYRTETRRVLKSPARVDEVTIPAEYATITKTVVKSPARVDEQIIPAEYKSIPLQIIADTGKYTDWVEVLCEEKRTTYTISQLQQYLKDRGFDPGPIDGVIGSKTLSALEGYQKQNNLPIGDINIETLKALGLPY